MKLSFPDSSFDLIVCNDLFEHISHPEKGFAECARALRAGGTLLATIPFHSNYDFSVSRAIITNGRVEHLMPPVWHGNPITSEGSLLFTDFGWDVLNKMQSSGFSDVSVESYASAEFGHIGSEQLIFRLIK